MSKRKVITLISVIAILAVLPAVFLLISTNKKAPLTVSSEGFDVIDVNGEYIYSLKAPIDSLLGEIRAPESFDYLEYSIALQNGYVLDKGKMTIERNWAIPTTGIWLGHSCLTVTASSIDGESETISVILYNSNSEFKNTYGTEKRDSDDDGVNDLHEIICLLTDPLVPDTDKNGTDDGAEDFDGDGLLNADEIKYNSDPFADDTDGDDLNDLQETVIGTDPTKADTDGDGIKDGIEYEAYLDPLNKEDGNSGLTVLRSESFDNGTSVDLSLYGAANKVTTVEVKELPQASIISPATLPGMIGSGISFTMEGGFDSATVYVTVPDELPEDGKFYGLYYVNEDELSLERVRAQKRNGNVIWAELEHFSVYAVLDENEVGNAILALRKLIEDTLIGIGDELNKDTDGDGFLDFLDPTPFSPEAFASYEHYLNFFYPTSDVVSLMINPPPGWASGVVIDEDNYVGHTWIAYRRAGQKSETTGFCSGSVFTFATNVGIAVKGGVRAPEYLYFTDDPKTRYDYDEYSEEPEDSNAVIALPILVSNEAHAAFTDFYGNYSKKYDLNNNNCTTYATQCLERLGISLSLNSYFPPDFETSAFNEFADFFTSEAGSPGRAAYSVLKNYGDVCVKEISYILKDGSTVKAYTSGIANELASFVHGSETYSDAVNKTEMGTIVKDALTYNGHTYKIFDSGYTWITAKTLCESYGGHLMTITSAEEQQIAEALLKAGQRNNYWLGATVNADGTFAWITNEDTSYTNWAPEQPDNFVGLENAMMIYNGINPMNVMGSGVGFWNDLSEDGTCLDEEFFGMGNFGFICEWDSAN